MWRAWEHLPSNFHGSTLAGAVQIWDVLRVYTFPARQAGIFVEDAHEMLPLFPASTRQVFAEAGKTLNIFEEENGLGLLSNCEPCCRRWSCAPSCGDRTAAIASYAAVRTSAHAGPAPTTFSEFPNMWPKVSALHLLERKRHSASFPEAPCLIQADLDLTSPDLTEWSRNVLPVNQAKDRALGRQQLADKRKQELAAMGSRRVGGSARWPEGHA